MTNKVQGSDISSAETPDIKWLQCWKVTFVYTWWEHKEVMQRFSGKFSSTLATCVIDHLIIKTQLHELFMKPFNLLPMFSSCFNQPSTTTLKLKGLHLLFPQTSKLWAWPSHLQQPAESGWPWRTRTSGSPSTALERKWSLQSMEGNWTGSMAWPTSYKHDFVLFIADTTLHEPTYCTFKSFKSFDTDNGNIHCVFVAGECFHIAASVCLGSSLLPIMSSWWIWFL